jgi:hypothetical protein
MSPLAGRSAQRKGESEMQGDNARERQVFSLFAACLMIGLILFGLLELMDVIHI